MALTGAQRQKKWREANRVLWNLRRRNLRKGSSLVEKEAAVESNRSRTEMARSEILGGGGNVSESKSTQRSGGGCKTVEVEGESKARLPSTNQPDDPLPAQTSKDETLAKLREMVKQEQEKPSMEGSRSHRDVVGGIYRNDFGGVISKFAWEKLQRLKSHAKENNFEIDEYSQ